MITSINEYKQYLKETKFPEDQKAQVIEQLKWQNHPYIYHATAHGKMYEYLYGPKSAQGNPEKLFKNPPTTPNYVLEAGITDHRNGKDASCWTMDPHYTWAAFNDGIPIRLVLNVEKLKPISNRLFYGDGNISEAEVRIEGDLINWPQYLHEIQTTKRFFEKAYNDEEFEITFAAFKHWLPKELHKFIKFYSEDFFDDHGTLGRNAKVILGTGKYEDIGFE